MFFWSLQQCLLLFAAARPQITRRLLWQALCPEQTCPCWPAHAVRICLGSGSFFWFYRCPLKAKLIARRLARAPFGSWWHVMRGRYGKPPQCSEKRVADHSLPVCLLRPHVHSCALPEIASFANGIPAVSSVKPSVLLKTDQASRHHQRLKRGVAININTQQLRGRLC